MEIDVKKVLFWLIFLTYLVSFNYVSFAAVLDTVRGEEQKEALRYVPGEVLVKFKEGADPQRVLQDINFKTTAISRVHSIKPTVARFKKTFKLKKDSDGWYWFMGKNYKEINDVPDEELFKEAYKKMPPTEKSLYRSYKISLPEGISVEEAVTILEGNPNVEYAQPNYIMELQMVPNDPYYHSSGSWGQDYDDLWGLKRDKLNCEDAWDISQGEGVIVAVIDTGVDYNHEDISGNIWVNEDEIPDNGIDDDGNGYIDDVRGYDFSGDDPEPIDYEGHGTHVAGTIAAVGNNSIGIIGVSPKAQIMPVKIFPWSYSDVAAQAIRYAADNGARVMNNSWGAYGVSSDPIVEEAVDYAVDMGCVVICAAGNEYGDVALSSPANYHSTISVGAVDHRNMKAPFSNTGELLDVVAPGVGILSARAERGGSYNPNTSHIVDEDYSWKSGTSMSTPHVSGIAALLLSLYPGMKNEDVRLSLHITSIDLGEQGRDNDFGYGLANAYLAVTTGHVEISITSPPNHGYIRGVTDIRGTIFVGGGIDRYELFYASYETPENMILFETSTSYPDDGILGSFDTTLCNDGKYILTLKVICTNGLEIVRSIEVTIDNHNEPPVLHSIGNKLAVIGKPLQFTVEAEDPDDPATPWGSLNYSLQNPPPGAEFNPETHQFFWEPAESDKGTYEVTFHVEDSEFEVSQTITISTVYLETIQITDTPPNLSMSHDYLRKFFPCIYGDKVVWYEGDSYGNDYIYMYSFINDSKTQIGTTVEGYFSYQLYPMIYKEKVVWEKYTSKEEPPYDTHDIYLYDLATRSEKLIPGQPFEARTPFIYEDKVIYVGNEGLDTPEDVYMYDIATETTSQITHDAVYHSRTRPAMDGDIIVYSSLSPEEEAANVNVFMYNLSTQTEIRVSPNPSNQSRPDISGQRIIWHDDRNKNPDDPELYYDVYMYELSTGKETQLTEGGRTYWGSAKIHGEKIVYQEIFKRYDNRGRSIREDRVVMHDLLRDAKLYFPSEAYVVDDSPDIFENIAVWIRRIYNEDGNWLYSQVVAAIIYYVPKIAEITPRYIYQGGTIKIIGQDFGYLKRGSQVLFANGLEAQVEYWSNSEIICRVPSGAVSGPVKVVTPGGESNGVSITIIPLPEPPYNLRASNIRAHSVTLKWEDASSNELGFRIYRHETDTSYRIIANVEANATTYIDNTVQPNTYYWYRVRAYNAAGGRNSNSIRVKTPARVNLVTNPDMEQGSGYTATGWTSYNNPLGRVNYISHSPSHSLMIYNFSGQNAGFYGKEIVFNEDYGRRFTFGGWSKAAYVNGGLYCLDFRIEFTDGTVQWFFPQELRFSPGSHDWEHKSITVTFPKDVKKIRPYLLLYCSEAYGRGYGIAWFDDIYVYED